ncbi:MAG: hypothetical protein LBV17_00785 [Treponema sp.]|jgi:hypothetical protein|nr:hypothetical protein [Treponema sp.]
MTELKDDLTLSKKQRDHYRSISSDLQNSLVSTIKSCEDLSMELNKSRKDLAAGKKLTRILLVIAAVIIAAKIVSFALYYFRVRTISWLDILL